VTDGDAGGGDCGRSGGRRGRAREGGIERRGVDHPERVSTAVAETDGVSVVERSIADGR
jgi:hypothetical protein